MANRWKGNIIAAAATTSSGTDYTGKANGAWGLNSQLQQKQGGLWAKGIGAPSAPTIGTATGGNAQATVTFTASTESGGGTISSYTATSTPSGITGSSATSPITVTGLTNGTAYTFTVRANSNFGSSAESAASNSVTPVVPTGPSIGTPMGGGFYGGTINDGGVNYYLIVSPKATGYSNLQFGPYGTSATTYAQSLSNGPANTSLLASRGVSYPAAVFCENLVIGGYNDWYLPAKNELEVLYFFLKPSTEANNTESGANSNAVTPEPINTNYTTTFPPQTIAGINFRAGETQAFEASNTWSSTEDLNVSIAPYYAWYQQFTDGYQRSYNKSSAREVRAIRRIPA